MSGCPPPPHPALHKRVVANEHADRLRALAVCYRAVDPKTQLRPRLRQLGEHTLFLGTTGSGKTTALKLHMQSVLRPVDPRFAMNFRALVYDAKTDLVPFLAGIGFGLESHVILTNPFDQRAVAWDIASDVDSYAAAESFAELLVQDRADNESPFWQTAARELVANTIHGLNQPLSDGRRAHWTLRHLVSTLESKELMRQVLSRTPSGLTAIADYIDCDSKLAGSIAATLRSNIAPHRLIAAACDKASHSFSVRAWANGGGILLVGNHYAHAKSIQRFNNILVRFAIETAMDRPDDIRDTTTWFYLDELKQAGRFPAFNTMLTQGRSKGIRSVLTAQGLSTLKAAFDEGEVEEVLNNCSEKCIMQLGTPEDAEWAERLFSTARRIKVGTHVSDDPTQRPSYNYTEVVEPKVESRMFLELQSARDTGRGLDAYYHAPGGEHSRTTTPGPIVQPLLVPSVSLATLPPASAPRENKDFEPRPLAPAELKFLGLRGTDQVACSPPSVPRFRVPPAPR